MVNTVVSRRVNGTSALRRTHVPPGLQCGRVTVLRARTRVVGRYLRLPVRFEKVNVYRKNRVGAMCVNFYFGRFCEENFMCAQVHPYGVLTRYGPV